MAFIFGKKNSDSKGIDQNKNAFLEKYFYWSMPLIVQPVFSHRKFTTK
jgi:hypothetical protein